MKNIQGTEENLELFNENGIIVYSYYKNSYGYIYEYTYDSKGKVLTYKDSNGFSCEYTRDSNGNELTYKDSDGFNSEYTYDSQGKVLTYKNSNGFSCEYTRDSNGNELTYKDSNGFSYEYTYDSQGKELTYKDSNGESRGFDIPEYTTEEVYNLLEQSMKDCHLWELEEHYSGDYKNLKEWFEQFKKKQ